MSIAEAAVGADSRGKPRGLPGVDGLWVALGADSAIFAILFANFMQARSHNPAVFESSRLTLNMNLGGVNTLVLLTSSWSVALAIQALKRNLTDQVPRYLLGGMITGLLFMTSKSIEYYEKFAAGITPGTNEFYMWYFTLTGFHLLHVIFGTSLLTYLWVRSRRGAYNSLNRVVPECVASYWHLVDYLWVVIFPLLYLQKVA